MPVPGKNLRAYLASRFAEGGGRMPFGRFMELALYDPDHGYYTSHVADIGGRRADFATAATLSPVLGRAIAVWIRREREKHGFGRDCHLIEVGGGDGNLAREILDALSWRERRSLVYHLVEISPRLEELQRETIGRSLRKRVRWHRAISEAVEAAAGEALVFSNELVDAFPARLFRWNEERAAADEVWLEYDEQRGIREIFIATDEGAPDGMAIADGQRYERHDAFRRWLDSWAPSLKRGSVLTIDYGGVDASEIYAKRPMGTLRGYHRHQRCEGSLIYRHFGRQDLTCDVAFADVQAWGEAHGWVTAGLGTQAEFFRGYLGEGFFEGSRATAFLLDADGAGGAFKVLHQRVGEA